MFVSVFFAVFVGGGFLIWLRLPNAHKNPPPAPPVEKVQPVQVSANDPLMEDLNIHFQNAIRSAIRASELAHQSQRRIRAVMPALERDYLVVEKTRLVAADSLAEGAIRESNHAAEELEVALKLTQQKLNQGEKQQ